MLIGQTNYLTTGYHAEIIWHLMLVTYKFLPFRYVICSKPDKLENLQKPEGIFIEVDNGELD